MNGWVYIKICKGIYGLKQNGILAWEQLERFLEPHSYALYKITLGLWKCTTCTIDFSRVVNDFRVKYVRNKHINHLTALL